MYFAASPIGEDEQKHGLENKWIEPIELNGSNGSYLTKESNLTIRYQSNIAGNAPEKSEQQPQQWLTSSDVLQAEKTLNCRSSAITPD